MKKILICTVLSMFVVIAASETDAYAGLGSSIKKASKNISSSFFRKATQPPKGGKTPVPRKGPMGDFFGRNFRVKDPIGGQVRRDFSGQLVHVLPATTVTPAAPKPAGSTIVSREGIKFDPAGNLIGYTETTTNAGAKTTATTSMLYDPVVTNPDGSKTIVTGQRVDAAGRVISETTRTTSAGGNVSTRNTTGITYDAPNTAAGTGAANTAQASTPQGGVGATIGVSVSAVRAPATAIPLPPANADPKNLEASKSPVGIVTEAAGPKGGEGK